MNTTLRLTDFFSSQLTADQKRAIARLDDFLMGDVPIFLLKGYAGTGKTFLLTGLVKYLIARQYNFRLMAPTGRAARVLQKETHAKAATIHRTIYRLEQTQELPPEDADDNVSFKHYFEIRANEDMVNTVYIVDESSMISDLENDETEFLKFGSDRLLHDLLEYVNPGSAGLQRKIIFVGDTAQLPPVGSPDSPALNADYLTTTYRLPVQEFTLTDVVRQKAGSGILSVATTLRNAIRTQKFHTFAVDDTPDDITSVRPGAFMPTFLKASGNRIDGSTIIITHSNRAALEYNREIRAHLFPQARHIMPGDKIIVVRNSYHHRRTLFNGEFGKVLKVSEQVETKVISFNIRGGGKKKITLHFRDVDLRFWEVDGSKFDVSSKIIDSLLDSPQRGLTPEEARALYVDFKMRHPKLKPNTKPFQDALLDDPYFNALQIKFGYAITCHKAQGGEWPHVLVDFDTSQGKTNEAFFRWAYTAVTRAQKHLYAINAPHFNRFSGLNISGLATAVPTNAPAADENLFANLWKQIEQALSGTEFIIENVQHLQYRERYLISGGGHHCMVDVSYKKNGRISRIDVRGNEPAVTEKIKQRMTSIVGKSTNHRKDGHTLHAFDTTQPECLQELYDKITTAVATHGIKIIGVKHNQFQEIYNFQKDDQMVRIDFFYNGKGQITSARPHQSARYAPELLEILMGILEDIRYGNR